MLLRSSLHRLLPLFHVALSASGLRRRGRPTPLCLPVVAAAARRMKSSPASGDCTENPGGSNPNVAKLQSLLADSSEGGWEKCWEEGFTPWDIGKPTPVILHLLQTGALPNGRALVPGCGSGHDVVAMACPERFVVGLDISESAIKKACKVGDYVGGPPYAVSVSGYKEVLNPVGFEAVSIVENDLSIEPRKERAVYVGFHLWRKDGRISGFSCSNNSSEMRRWGHVFLYLVSFIDELMCLVEPGEPEVAEAEHPVAICTASPVLLRQGLVARREPEQEALRPIKQRNRQIPIGDLPRRPRSRQVDVQQEPPLLRVGHPINLDARREIGGPLEAARSEVEPPQVVPDQAGPVEEVGSLEGRGRDASGTPRQQEEIGGYLAEAGVVLLDTTPVVGPHLNTIGQVDAGIPKASCSLAASGSGIREGRRERFLWRPAARGSGKEWQPEGRSSASLTRASSSWRM
ncbi:hypothetical protein Taro_033414 [Colocasia esculenta]|uniref:Thiol methyltransferase 2 n=1 Tax=Colocasia esculenta TaxID=4460 RepID=A0A843VXU1_COLES|nr:hypothetical protein [Colocasia esculenta]